MTREGNADTAKRRVQQVQLREYSRLEDLSDHNYICSSGHKPQRSAEDVDHCQHSGLRHQQICDCCHDDRGGCTLTLDIVHEMLCIWDFHKSGPSNQKWFLLLTPVFKRVGRTNNFWVPQHLYCRWTAMLAALGGSAQKQNVNIGVQICSWWQC